MITQGRGKKRALGGKDEGKQRRGRRGKSWGAFSKK